MADEVVVDETTEETSVADRAWSQLEDEVEIVDEDDVVEEPQVEEPDPELTGIKARLAQYENREGTDSQIAASLAKLGDVLGNLEQNRTPKNEQAVAKTVAELKKEIEKTYYDSPVDATEKLIDAKIREMVGPALAQIAQRVQTTEKDFTKSQVMTDPVGKLVYDKYTKEVDKLVDQGMGYDKAVKQVSADHMTEVIELRVQEALSNQKANPAEPAPKAKNLNPSVGGRRPEGGPQQIVMSKAVRARLENEADLRGIPFTQYAAWIKKNQPERLKGGK